MVRSHDYLTAAFTENAYVDAVPFQRGFDVFEADRRNRRVEGGLMEDTLARASQWLHRWHAEGPFLLFVHTYEVHAPYSPPEDARALVPSDALALPPRIPPPSEDGLADAVAYTAEVAHMDRLLGHFFSLLESLGRADDTIVVVVSDHGEAFGEHGVRGHGTGLFEEQLRIPMIWHAPGRIEAGRRVRGLVGLSDVTPTILELLGIGAPSWMQGRSLARYLAPGAPLEVESRPYPVVAMGRSRGLRQDDWKVSSSHPRSFFALASDPDELHPSGAPRGPVERARVSLQEACRAGRAGLAAAAATRLTLHGPQDTADRVEKLRALGYLE
jgi:arylsulfatase A-like enzyme